MERKKLETGGNSSPHKELQVELQVELRLVCMCVYLQVFADSVLQQ